MVQWQVSLYSGTFTPNDWDENNDTKVECGNSGMLSNYTTEMNNIIGQFKANSTQTIDKNTYYLFLVKGLSGDAKGYMPLGKNYGFVTATTLSETSKTAAHELGHGAFNLYHTFSENSQYMQTEKSTDNLMDYSEGTELYKYQWDNIHNPEMMLSLLQGDEEAMSLPCLGWTDDCDEVLVVLKLIKDTYSKGTLIKLKPNGTEEGVEIITGNNLKVNEKDYPKISIHFIPVDNGLQRLILLIIE